MKLLINMIEKLKLLMKIYKSKHKNKNIIIIQYNIYD